jgi:cell division protein FtsI/penicillin-binding protein 2
MNARLHAQAQANERIPYAQKVDPAYFANPDREIAFIESEGKRLAEVMQARLLFGAPDEYQVAQAFASSSNAAFYRVMQLAAQGKAGELLAEVKKLADEAIDQRADLLATQEWQKIDL